MAEETPDNIVEEVENPDEEVTLKEARKIRPDAQLGETVWEEIEVKNAGRIQAQTAKQNCPVSKALAGTEITLDAKLV